jgi:hypothetical protein
MTLPAITFKSFAGQNWLITPAAPALGQVLPPETEQTWLIVFTGVGIIDLQGWKHFSLVIYPDVGAPLQHAIQKFNIQPPAQAPPGLGLTPHIELEQWAPFAAVSGFSHGGEHSNGDYVGFEVEKWRPNPFAHFNDVSGTPRNQIFTGIQVDLEVRTKFAIVQRVSYHFTLLGKIVFLVTERSKQSPKSGGIKQTRARKRGFVSNMRA